MPSIDSPAGCLTIVCGLSGSGKSTLVEHAISRYSPTLKYLTTFTTRPHRPSDQEFEYNFITNEEYELLKQASSAWDESIIYGNKYGVDSSAYIQQMKQGYSFIVCATPDITIIDQMRGLYSGIRIKTIHLLTDPSTSARRKKARDSFVSLSRLTHDKYIHAQQFRSDYTLVPGESLETDKINFDNIIKEIIYG